ncbi:MAG TPA: hypothetical protein PLE19_11560 [Planctomycetota bacterium]|nr:hypothetical protein [Planctomycetota bacterium]HRR78763.1 hypothetical protein [Planctomycetota bacterium]HRT97539.1 hypothetical protein [Planctomycetota bacterium]
MKTMRTTGGPGGRLRKGLLLTGLGLLTLVACGCEEWLGLTYGRPGIVRLGRGSVVVLPFATPGRKYFESEVGRRFSHVVADLIREGCPAARVIDCDGLPETIEGQSLDQIPIADIGNALGADYVVIGELHELRSKDPGSYRVLKGTIVVSARVFESRSGSVIWQIMKRTSHYPHLVAGEQVPAETTNEEEVILKVMREGAWPIAAVFRGPRSHEELRLAD